MSSAEVAISEDKPCPPSSWTTWTKYSEGMLRTVEKKILQYIKASYKGYFVDIGPVVGQADKIWTISLNYDSDNTPLVLLHGLGAGVALWCLNLDSLAAARPVYALDLLGFGRSSRPKFSSDGTEVEQQMVRALEEWRKETKLDKFNLLGHSMGGFLATSYAINYPERVNHLILADPWGFPDRSEREEKPEIPFYYKMIGYALRPFNPLWAIRAAGPFGEWLIGAARPDLPKKFSTVLKDEALITQYLYQCNSQTPSGESAFHSMMVGFGWAKNPMVHRIDNLHKNVPVTVIYGSKSWVDNSAGQIIKNKRYDSYVKLHAILAGHHVYADKPDHFNQLVNDTCALSDMSNNILPTSIPKLEMTHSEETADLQEKLEEKPDTLFTSSTKNN